MKLYATTIFATLILSAVATFGQTTAFTYQGKLTDGGTASNGTYDLTFKLYDLQSGGTQIGTDQVKEDVSASNGIFTVVLDFGASPFTSNSGNYLEISIRPGASTGSYTMLAPRQPITSSPYAAQALRSTSSATADTTANFTGTLGGDVTGTQNSAVVTRLQNRSLASTAPTGGQVLTWNAVSSQWEPGNPQTGNFIQNTTTPQASSNFNISGSGVIGGNLSVAGSISGSGAGLTNLSPGNIAAGTAAINVQGHAAGSASVGSGAVFSVAGKTMIVLEHASATTITDLSDGVNGQCVTLLATNGNVLITNGGNFRVSSDWDPISSDTLTVCRNTVGGNPFWYEHSRSRNGTPPNFTLQVQVSGGGFITSRDPGIRCGTDCSESYPQGTMVVLDHVRSDFATFQGFGGACSGRDSCIVNIQQQTDVFATYVPTLQSLNVVKIGDGAGTVTSSPSGINCGSGPLCTSSFQRFSSVTLTAAPDQFSTFIGWSGGGCSGTGTCIPNLESNASTTANFVLNQLSIIRTGNGAGTVSTNDSRVSCGVDCSETYIRGTSVTLTAQAFAGSIFTGWSGEGCTGTGTCTVTIAGKQNVLANFHRTFNLSVALSGSGSGNVASSPSGIDCGATCTAPFIEDTIVTLTASSSSDSYFVGWSGAGCSGTGTCVVTMSEARSVTAEFAPTFALTVTREGTGTGVVESSPPGINCGSRCTARFASGTVVSLVATATSGSTFVGWSGACTGTASCVVTMDAAKAVTAMFDPPRLRK